MIILIGGFGEWVQQKAPAKAPRIFEWATANKQAVAALFQAFLEISSLKNQVVRQLDAQAHDVTGQHQQRTRTRRLRRDKT
jgi:hypothetical protein